MASIHLPPVFVVVQVIFLSVIFVGDATQDENASKEMVDLWKNISKEFCEGESKKFQNDVAACLASCPKKILKMAEDCCEDKKLEFTDGKKLREFFRKKCEEWGEQDNTKAKKFGECMSGKKEDLESEVMRIDEKDKKKVEEACKPVEVLFKHHQWDEKLQLIIQEWENQQKS